MKDFVQAIVGRCSHPALYFTALVLLAFLPKIAQAQAPQADRLQVLFLGDDRLHQPFARAKQLLPALARNGIDMFYTDDASDLNTENLSNYHALIFYNNQPTISDPELQALLKFVENGGGLSVIHSGSASFQNSEAFIRLVGGAFKSHGTGTFSVTRASNDHPAVRGVPTFESWDETYIHTKLNPVNRTILEVRSENGHDEPWTWVRTYGKGRVFYTAWGHDERTFGQEGFQQLVAQGTKWAAGDWALNRRLNEPTPAIARLEVPMPSYVQGAPWNTLGPPIYEGQVALRPEESIALTTLLPDFSMQLFAMDPMVRRIIDFTWDARGRMWAVETNDYPNDVLPDSVPGDDRILIIEDTNRDGRADKSTVFAEGFNLATSLVLIDGGVVVAQAPHFFFLRDTNGDDKADEKRQIMTGWPRNDTHGTPSNLRYNIDNQILGSVGYNGFRGTVAGRTYGQGEFGAGYFTMTPDGQNLDYLARTSNNTWGVALSEDGLIFGSTANDRPSQYVHIPARYYLGTGMREPVLPGIHNRSDIYANHDIVQVDWFGAYTSGAAHELYTARAFPAEYWNRKAFVTDPTGNLIGMFDLQPQGSTFRAENEWSFLMSRDDRVAPVQVKVGPDGALWVSDFYTLVAQHNPYVEMEGCCPRGVGNAYETPNRNKEMSRIWRISYDGAPAYTPLRLDNATPAQLVANLKNNNMFWRYMAQRLIVERGQQDVVPAIIALVNDHTMDNLSLNPGALHGIWTLHGLGALNGSNASALQAVTNALYHPSASIRRAALIALPRDAQLEDAVLDAGILPDRTAPGTFNQNNGSIALQDADPLVRVQALITLSELPASARIGNAIRDMIILPINLRDRWIPDAAAIAATKHNQGLALELLQRQPAATDSAYLAGARTVVQFVTRSLARDGNISAVIELMAAAPAANAFIAQGVFDGIAGPAQDAVVFRSEWRNERGGWAENSAPTLTDAQRATLIAAARAAPAALSPRFTQVATRWTMPTLFQ